MIFLFERKREKGKEIENNQSRFIISFIKEKLVWNSSDTVEVQKVDTVHQGTVKYYRAQKLKSKSVILLTSVWPRNLCSSYIILLIRVRPWTRLSRWLAVVSIRRSGCRSPSTTIRIDT